MARTQFPRVAKAIHRSSKEASVLICVDFCQPASAKDKQIIFMPESVLA